MGWGIMDEKAVQGMVDNEQKSVDAVKSGKYFKAKQNANIIRILPGWNKNVKWGFKWVWQHAFKDSEGKNRMIVCPKTAGHREGKKTHCIICDHIIPNLKVGNTDDQALGNKLKASIGVMCNIIDRSNVAAGPMIWRMSSTKLYPQILAAVNDPDFGDNTNPDAGHDITLTRTGEGWDTKYSLQMKPRKTKVDLSNLEPHDLDAEYMPASNEEMADMMAKAYGFVGLDEYLDTLPEEWRDGTPTQVKPETAPAGEKKKANAKAKPAPVEAEEEAEDGGDDGAERIAIQIPDKMKGATREKFLAMACEASECFGSLFSEDSEECAKCKGMMKCASESTEDDESDDDIPF